MTTMRSSFDAMRPNTWWGWCAMRIGIAAHGIAHVAASVANAPETERRRIRAYIGAKSSQNTTSADKNHECVRMVFSVTCGIHACAMTHWSPSFHARGKFSRPIRTLSTAASSIPHAYIGYTPLVRFQGTSASAPSPRGPSKPAARASARTRRA